MRPRYWFSVVSLPAGVGAWFTDRPVSVVLALVAVACFVAYVVASVRAGRETGR